MDKFLERHNIQNHLRKNLKAVNNTSSIKQTELVIKTSQRKLQALKD